MRDDLREPYHVHGVLLRDLPVVELREERGEVFGPPDLGVVVLDLARGEVAKRLHVDLVDHGVEDLLAGAEPDPAPHRDAHPLLALAGLVAQTDRRGLAMAAEPLGGHRRAEDW